MGPQIVDKKVKYKKKTNENNQKAERIRKCVTYSCGASVSKDNKHNITHSSIREIASSMHP